MRVTFKIYRTAKVRTEDLKSVSGLAPEATNDKAAKALSARFGPHFAFGFKVFWGTDPCVMDERASGSPHSWTVAGVEAMGVELAGPGDTPKAFEGLASLDYMDEKGKHRLDGALASELQRMGLWSDADKFEWRGWYEVRG